MEGELELRIWERADREQSGYTTAAVKMLEESEATIERLTKERDELAAALDNVMSWINNWSPNFEDDESWPADRDRVNKVLAKHKEQTT